MSSSVITMEEPNAEAASTDAGSEVLDFSRRDYSTGAEKVLREALFARLQSIGYTGTVSTQELLVIPLGKRGAQAAIRSQLSELVSRFATARFTLRRGDFFLPQLGIIIEVDGSAHDLNDHRCRRDRTREAEYALLGCSVYVISNDDVYDPVALARHLDRICELMGQEKQRGDYDRAYARRRTAISRARKEFRLAFPNINIGAFKRRQDRAVRSNGTVGSAQWEGTRFSFYEPSKSRRWASAQPGEKGDGPSPSVRKLQKNPM